MELLQKEVRTCELVELEDGVFEGGDVSQGGGDGAKDGVVGDVKVAELARVANTGRDHPRQLVVVHCQHLRAHARLTLFFTHFLPYSIFDPSSTLNPEPSIHHCIPRDKVLQ